MQLWEVGVDLQSPWWCLGYGSHGRTLALSPLGAWSARYTNGTVVHWVVFDILLLFL